MSVQNLNKHPAEYFLRYLLIKDPQTTDAILIKTLDDWGILQPGPSYWGFLRQRTFQDFPDNFNPADRMNLTFMRYLREQKVYELFYATKASEEAWSILADPNQRMYVEQVLMARLDLKAAAKALNKKNGWFLTEEGLQAYYHFFWNVRLLTFDEWGRFLFDRTAMYDRHLTLLQASPSLAFFHLRLEQNIESKRMIQRVQEIAYHTVEEVNLQPGTRPDKVKAIALLGKVVVECHNSLSTSDMALKDVLQQFERFRMDHPKQEPAGILELAPGGNFTGSGAEEKKEEQGAH